MALEIKEKGVTVPLRGANSVQTAMIGMGWDVNEGQSQDPIDLDVSLVARDAQGQAKAVLYYDIAEPTEDNPNPNPNPYRDWMIHHGDNLTGEGVGDDEQIELFLSKVPPEYPEIDVVVTIYNAAERKQNFGLVDHAYCRVMRDGEELVKFDLGADKMFDETGVHVASFVRSGPAWDFKTVGEAKPGYHTLQDIVNATEIVQP